MKLIVIIGSLIVSLATSQAPLESHFLQQQETVNLDPSLTNLIDHAVRSIELSLQNHQREFDKKLSELENTCNGTRNSSQIDFEHLPQDLESKVEALVGTFTDQLLRFSEDAIQTVEEKIAEALDGALEQVDIKLAAVHIKVNDLSTNLSVLVTQEEAADLQNKLTEMAANAVDNIKTELSYLPKEGDVNLISYLTEGYLQNIGSQLEMLNVCENKDAAENILKYLQESDKNLKNVSEFLQDSSRISSCSSSCDKIHGQLQSLHETLEVNKNTLDSLNASFFIVKDSLTTPHEEPETTPDVIIGTHRSQAATTTTTTSTTTTTTTVPPFITRAPTTQNPVPCLNSRFTGVGIHLNVCGTAVLFRICYLPFVAYHCCRSCMDAGLISSPPDFTGPRTLNILQVLKGIKHKKLGIVG